MLHRIIVLSAAALFQGDIALDSRLERQIKEENDDNKVSRELITSAKNRWKIIGEKVEVPYVIDGTGNRPRTFCSLHVVHYILGRRAPKSHAI